MAMPEVLVRRAGLALTCLAFLSAALLGGCATAQLEAP
jgi:hypothetical protein